MNDILNNKDLLYQEYIINNLPVSLICEKYSVTTNQIKVRIKKYGFKKSKEQITEAIKKGNIAKYGVSSTLALKEVQDKIKETNLDKYGCKNPMQNTEIQTKVKQTNLEKYGHICSLQNDVVKAKTNTTLLEKYGTLYATQNKEVQEKTKLTNLAKYGVEHSSQNNGVKAKLKQTNIERYGCECSLQNKEVQAKSQQTIESKYNVSHIMQSAEIQEKIKQTNIKKYGVEHHSQNIQVQLKRKQTNLARYGVEHPMQSIEIRNKLKNTFICKYNKPHIQLKQESLEFFADKNVALAFLESFNDKPHIIDIANRCNLSYKTVLDYIHKYELEAMVKFYDHSSSYERELIEILDNLNILYQKNVRPILDGKEIDIYLPDYKIGIEFNGSYWHSEEYKDYLYHQQKSLLAEEKGIFIYHIFEYEWNNEDMKIKIINQLKNLLKLNSVKIYARKCIIKEVDSKEKSDFLKQNHLQGNDHSSINLGLYYEDGLVSLMTLSKPRFNKKYNWELSRFCSKAGCNVIGAASKLFSYFVKNYLNHDETIISYSHISHTTGKVYEKLGFELSHISKPSYVWWKNNKEVLSRYQTMQLNETQIMKNNGYVRIYDCGNKVWTYKKN